MTQRQRAYWTTNHGIQVEIVGYVMGNGIAYAIVKCLDGTIANVPIKELKVL